MMLAFSRNMFIGSYLLWACMTKLLHYAYAVVKNRAAFDADHVWRDTSIAA